MLMPFGKHKGREVASLDHAYLEWLQENCDLKGELAEEVSRLLGTEIDDDQAEKCRFAVCQMVEHLDKRRLARFYSYAQRLLDEVL